MISTYLELGTNHLRQHTMHMLSTLTPEQRMGNGWPAFTVAPYLHGVFVTVPEENDDTLDQLDNLPSDLWDVFSHARSYGVPMIRFDSDGPINSNLEVFVW